MLPYMRAVPHAGGAPLATVQLRDVGLPLLQPGTSVTPIDAPGAGATTSFREWLNSMGVHQHNAAAFTFQVAVPVPSYELSVDHWTSLENTP